MISTKGSRCSYEGKKYELHVYNILKNCVLNNIKFNTQSESDLGGCCPGNDIICKFEDREIPIEIKKSRTPDWMQCSLRYNEVSQKWTGKSTNKITEKSKQIFQDLLSHVILFNGCIPPFMTRDITHEEWLKIKEGTTNFNDTYMDCPSDTIKNLYKNKGCFYIQLSDKGLYHLGNDICNFNVPEFVCDQQLRIRTKVHIKKNKKGFSVLSVTVSCQPKDIQGLPKSPYSLDDIHKLPPNLHP